MIERVISGGQTGADQGGLRAAQACGIPTGGWAPRGWLTEAGPAPWLADWGLVECQEGESAAGDDVPRPAGGRGRDPEAHRSLLPGASRPPSGGGRSGRQDVTELSSR
jgi:hypothetical protein